MNAFCVFTIPKARQGLLPQHNICIWGFLAFMSEQCERACQTAVIGRQFDACGIMIEATGVHYGMGAFCLRMLASSPQAQKVFVYLINTESEFARSCDSLIVDKPLLLVIFARGTCVLAFYKLVWVLWPNLYVLQSRGMGAVIGPCLRLHDL